MSNKQVLTKEKPESAPFKFKGDCYLCVAGNGSFKIERKLSQTDGFEVMTDDQGIPLEFAGDGVLFNSVITCKRSSISHRIVAATTTEIHISYSAEQ